MKTILIAICCLLGLHLFTTPRAIEVKGQVTDASNGDPLIGVNISIQETQEGTVTDFNGYYKIEITGTGKRLQFDLPGYQTQVIAIDSSTTLDVVMEAETLIEEVEVTAVGKSRRLMDRVAGLFIQKQSADAAVLAPYEREEITWNTEDYDLIRENDFISTDEQQVSTFSADVDRASYSNLRRFISQGVKAPVDAVRIEEMINYFHYAYPEPVDEDPLAMYTELGSCPWNPKHQLLQIGIQSEKIRTKDLPAANLVFLIDVSGSMNESNKLPLLISSFHLLVDQLRPQDRVSIVTYAGASAVILDGTGGGEKEQIILALDRLTAGGSTAGAQGIGTAYNIARKNFIENGNNRVILATDGDFNVGVSSDAQLVRLIEEERNSGVYLSVLGFGMGNYKDNKMQQLAGHGNGNHQYIDDLAEAKKVFVDEFGSNLFTVAKDVKIQIEFNPEKVAGYRLIGYENRKLNNRDFADDKKDAGEIGNGHSVTVLYEIIPQGIDSEWLSTTERRYSPAKKANLRSETNEVAYLKIRYKEPDGATSKLMEKVISTSEVKQSEDFKWAASVACFGMLLRDSKYKANGNIDLVLDLAKQNLGIDKNNYRSEFIDLVKKANRVYLFNYRDQQVQINNE